MDTGVVVRALDRDHPNEGLNLQLSVPIALGVDDFAKLRRLGSMYIDKSFFVKRFLQDRCECNMILRPRRFGKSLNLSMLRNFLSDSIDSRVRTEIFEGLMISQSTDFCSRHMGKYPVISLCFKQCQGTTWQRVRARIVSQLEDAFIEYMELVNSLLPTGNGLILSERLSLLSDVNLASLLAKLIKQLHRIRGKQVILLVDEYDAPLNSKMDTEEDERIRETFFADMYSDALKSNTSLLKACLVGVAEIRGSGILSGVNNLGIASIPDEIFDDCFGFTEVEVKRALLDTLHLPESQCEQLWSGGGIKEWYNGYRFGRHKLVNPWSFTKFVYNNFKLGGYWVETSSSNAVFKLMIDNPSFGHRLIEALEHLLRTTSNSPLTYAKLPVEKFRSELSIRTNGNWNSDKALHFLCMTGYLTYEETDSASINREGHVWIPNRELFEEWTTVVKNFAGFDTLNHIMSFYKKLVNAFKTFDVNYIENVMKEKVASIPRRSGHHEYVFQSFVCGLLSVFNCDNGRLLMETGAGNGFADSTLHFDDINKSIIIEFKKADSSNNLESMANKALQQIVAKRYFESTSTAHQILLLGCAITNDNQVCLVSATIGAGAQRARDIATIAERFRSM